MAVRLESEWEHGGTRIEVAEADQRLRELGFAPNRLEPLAGGKANSTFLVELERFGRVVVRFHQRDGASGALETAIDRRLAGQVPMARVAEHFPVQGFSLVEWKPGLALERLAVEGRVDEIESVADELGEVCRTLDAVRFEATGFISPEWAVPDPWPSAVAGFSLFLDGCRKGPTLLQTAGAERLARIDRTLQRLRPTLEAASGPPRLAHGDFKPSNLLVHGGRLSAVLDWEFAHSGSWLSDVGQALRHEDELPDGFRRRFLAAAQRSEEEALLARAMDLFNLAGFLSRNAAAPTMKSDVLALVDRSLDALERKAPQGN